MGVRRQDWWQYCEDLSTGCPAYEMLTDAQIENGTDGDYGMLVPAYDNGRNRNSFIILRSWEETGWDHMPETRDELLQYCKDPKEKRHSAIYASMGRDLSEFI